MRVDLDEILLYLAEQALWVDVGGIGLRNLALCTQVTLRDLWSQLSDLGLPQGICVGRVIIISGDRGQA